MKLEKIAQLLDISSNNNSSTPNKNLSLSQSTSVPMQAASDILSYNLVAGKYIILKSLKFPLSFIFLSTNHLKIVNIFNNFLKYFYNKIIGLNSLGSLGHPGKIKN